MWVLQQINAMTMCSAAHETGINSSFMEMSGFPAQRMERTPTVTCAAEPILILMFSADRIKEFKERKTK